jgi:hypothetical protein
LQFQAFKFFIANVDNFLMYRRVDMGSIVDVSEFLTISFLTVNQDFENADNMCFLKIGNTTCIHMISIIKLMPGP